MKKELFIEHTYKSTACNNLSISSLRTQSSEHRHSSGNPDNSASLKSFSSIGHFAHTCVKPDLHTSRNLPLLKNLFSFSTLGGHRIKNHFLSLPHAAHLNKNHFLSLHLCGHLNKNHFYSDTLCGQSIKNNFWWFTPSGQSIKNHFWWFTLCGQSISNHFSSYPQKARMTKNHLRASAFSDKKINFSFLYNQLNIN